MYYPRAIEQALREASEQFPVLLLTGPRQVGKTTVLKHLCRGDRRYVTLDDPLLRSLANDDPALFLQRFPPPLLLDEVQYAPGLFPYIKMAVDEAQRPGAFWMTGSQHFHMMANVNESLAGRVAVVQLLGFSGRERHQRGLGVPPFLPTGEQIAERMTSAGPCGVDAAYEDIWLGSFPALIAGPVRDRDLFYGSYVQTYLERDVRALVQVADEQAFVRFLGACAARTAQLLNLSDLARDVDISVPTARQWLSILVSTGQVHLLQPYHSNVTKRLVKTPKLHFLDTGLCAYLTRWSSPQTLAAGAMNGAILETYALAEILRSWWFRGRQPELYFYRDRDGREIDFLFVHDGTLYPVEVKRGATPRRGWTRSFAVLDRFRGARGERAVLCLCREAVPFDQMNQAVPIGLL